MENIKILIIEDDPTTCNLLKTTLDMEGYQTNFVHYVENNDIFALLKNQNPDILFLDFHLATEDTLKYMIAVRNDSNWHKLPVLMTSAIDCSEECLAAGANSFILKPFNWDEITATIKQIRGQFLSKET